LADSLLNSIGVGVVGEGVIIEDDGGVEEGDAVKEGCGIGKGEDIEEEGCGIGKEGSVVLIFVAIVSKHFRKTETNSVAFSSTSK